MAMANTIFIEGIGKSLYRAAGVSVIDDDDEEEEEEEDEREEK